MHLDGARIWHVAIETGTPLKDLCDPFDSVSLCFSKGLGKAHSSITFLNPNCNSKQRNFRIQVLPSVHASSVPKSSLRRLADSGNSSAEA